MRKSVILFFKYAVVFILGFLSNTNDLLESIINIPISYNKLKKEYLYDTTLLSGQWSNNTDLLLNSEDFGLDHKQPMIVAHLNVNEFGEVNGEIVSKKICDTLPITWVISLESPEPNWRSLFTDRTFYLKQLKSGRMEIVATLKLIEKNDRLNTLKFKRMIDRSEILPEYITLAKNLPSYNSDVKFLSDYCSSSSRRVLNKLNKVQ